MTAETKAGLCLKWSLKLFNSKFGFKSLGNVAVSPMSKFTKMHSAVLNLLHAQKIAKRTDGRTE